MDWDKYTNSAGEIDLWEAFTHVEGFDDLDSDDILWAGAHLSGIECKQPIVSREVAAVALDTTMMLAFLRKGL